MRQLLDLSTTYLEDKGVGSARRCSEELIADVIGKRRIDLYIDMEHPLDQLEVARCREGLKRLAAREPYQYVLGAVEFCDCSLLVDSRALIPRQETEILVDKVIHSLAEVDSLDSSTFVDLCTGSGAIAIAVKKRFPILNVVALDLSEEALSLARLNAERNGVEIEFVQGDFLTPFEGRKADFIVCNPPYISESEYLELEDQVARYEPKLALVGGEDGFVFYRRLAEGVENYLNPGAKIWLEIGFQQGKWVEELFSFSERCKGFLMKDWSGHDRFFFLEFS